MLSRKLKGHNCAMSNLCQVCLIEQSPCCCCSSNLIHLQSNSRVSCTFALRINCNCCLSYCLVQQSHTNGLQTLWDMTHFHCAGHQQRLMLLLLSTKKLTIVQPKGAHLIHHCCLDPVQLPLLCVMFHSQALTALDRYLKVC